MSDTILAAEPTIRLAAFLGILATMALWAVAALRRRREVPRLLRWTNNPGIVVLDTLLVRLTFPVVAVGLALMAQDRGWGLLNVFEVPAALAFVAAVLALDPAIYLQHVMVHAVPVLWRLHRMQHADLEFDVTTGLRFHPAGILMSMGDRLLRLIVVTPDMRRVHHSADPVETNSNYGFNLPWWDRLPGTYRAQPARGHQGMEIGIEQFRTRRNLWLDRMLVQPLRGPASGHALDVRKERE